MIGLLVLGGLALAGLGGFSISKAVLENQKMRAQAELRKAEAMKAKEFTRLDETSRAAMTSSKIDDILLLAKKFAPVVSIVVGVVTVSYLFLRK